MKFKVATRTIAKLARNIQFVYRGWIYPLYKLKLSVYTISIGVESASPFINYTITAMKGVNISNGVTQRHPRGAIILHCLGKQPLRVTKPIWLLQMLSKDKRPRYRQKIFSAILNSGAHSFLNLIKVELWVWGSPDAISASLLPPPPPPTRRRGFTKFNLGNLVLSQV